MSKRFFAPALVTALVAIALPIGAQPAQQDFPDGPGKQIFSAIVAPATSSAARAGAMRRRAGTRSCV